MRSVMPDAELRRGETYKESLFLNSKKIMVFCRNYNTIEIHICRR